MPDAHPSSRLTDPPAVTPRLRPDTWIVATAIRQDTAAATGARPAFANVTRAYPEACANDDAAGTTTAKKRHHGDPNCRWQVLAFLRLRGRHIHLFPGLIRIEQVNAPGNPLGPFPEILLVDGTGMVDHECHDA